MAVTSASPDPASAASTALTEFPIVWPTAGDEFVAWQMDLASCPTAVPVLTYQVLRRLFDGFDRALRAFGMPARIESRHINGYLYVAVVPADGSDAATLSIDDVAGRLRELWSDEWLPMTQRAVAACHAFTPEATAGELLEHLERTLALTDPIWDAHFLLVFPQFLAMSRFEDYYADLFGADSSFDALRLLQGFDNQTLATDRALWQLSRDALADGAVTDVLRTTAAPDVPAALATSNAGRAFQARLDAFLATYGQRADDFDISTPRWWEDPTTPIVTIQSYLTRSDYDPGQRLAALAAERDHAIAATRAAQRLSADDRGRI